MVNGEGEWKLEIINQSNVFIDILVLMLITMTSYHAINAKQQIDAKKKIREYQTEDLCEQKVIEENRSLIKKI